MFFIFGSPRSGTTLLAQTLAAHSRIVVPYETDFIVPAAFVFDRVKDPDVGRPIIRGLLTHSAGFKKSLGELLDPAELDAILGSAEYSLAGLLKAIYERVAVKSSKSIAGDKSPNDLQFIRIIIKQLSDATDIKFIHIVRDLRDVMASIRARNWTAADADIYIPRMWNSTNLYLHELYRDDPSRYRFLRYEDMVTDPEISFRALCGFLGVEFESGMLDHQKRDPRFQRMRHHQNLLGPITVKGVGAHKDQLSAEQRLAYERAAAEAMRVFRYL